MPAIVRGLRYEVGIPRFDRKDKKKRQTRRPADPDPPKAKSKTADKSVRATQANLVARDACDFVFLDR